MADYKLDFSKLKESVSIHQAAQYLGLQLRSEGASMRGPCPACKQGGARALVVTPSKGVYYCWAYKKGGDAIQLVAHVKGCKPLEAAQQLDKHYGVTALEGIRNSSGNSTENGTLSGTVPNPSPQPRQGFDPGKYFERLSQEHEGLEPLGVSAGTLKALKAGYATHGRLAKRLALPVADKTGTVIGYCGIALDETAPRIRYPSDDFNPAAYLFNWEHIKDDEDFIYLSLDPLAVIKAFEGGVENAVAVLGTLDSDTLQTLSLWMEEKGISAIEPM